MIDRQAEFTSRVRTATLLTLILILAALLRFPGLSRQCYTLDEFWFAELSTGRGSAHDALPRDVVIVDPPRLTSLNTAPPLRNIAMGMSGTTHPPLFPMLLRVWRTMFGEGDAATRALSATASLASVLLLFDIVRLMHGNSFALWAALIMALAGPQIMLAREVRGYSALVVLCLATADALVRVETFGPSIRRIATMLAFALASLLTHYFAVAALTAMGLYALIRLRGVSRNLAAGALLGAGCIFVALWWPGLVAQQSPIANVGGNDHLSDHAPNRVPRLIGYAAALPVRLLAEPPKSSFWIACCGGVLYLIPILLLRRRAELWLWVLWLWCTAGLLAALDLRRSTRQLDVIRYGLIAGPAVYALLATMLKGARPWLAHALPACAALAGVMSLPAAYGEQRPDYRGLAQFVDQRYRTGEIVVFYSLPSIDWVKGALFLETSHYSNQFPWPTVILSRPPDASLRRRLRAAPGVWIISGSPQVPFDRIIPDTTVRDPGADWASFPYLAEVARVQFTTGSDD
ncbi:MAG: glycosyltransferase family 39 protein [Tepidisphaeraceae bacterium]